MSTKKTQNGFTLIELMIALLVFSFVSAIGVYTLRLGAEGKEQLENSETNLRETEIMRTLVKMDLLQTVRRPARDEFGALPPESFYGGAAHPQSAFSANERYLFSFVRAGWINPESKEARSSLQYVEYIERDRQLIRRVRPYIDRARNQPNVERVLLDDVESVRVSFLRGEVNGRFEWAPDWPIADGSVQTPRALSITVGNRRFGDVEHLFWIGEVL